MPMHAAEKRTKAPPSLLLSPRTFHRFTVDEYHLMIESGVFNDNGRVELLHGWIVDKMSHSPPHDSSVSRIARRLMRALSDDWVVRAQCAITLADSEPEPDVAVVKGPEEAYDTRHPQPKDVVWLVEVSDSTLLSDREYKGPLYARARIPMYWIVNLPEGLVEVYTQPKAGKSPAYRHRQDYGIDDAIPLVISGREVARIPVRELLPA